MLDDTAVGELPDPFAPSETGGDTPSSVPRPAPLDFVVRGSNNFPGGMPRGFVPPGSVVHRTVSSGPAAHSTQHRAPSQTAQSRAPSQTQRPLPPVMLPPPSSARIPTPAARTPPPPARTPPPAASPHTPPVDPRIGQTFAGRYGIKRILGRGAMGVVYEASDLINGGEAAIKVVPFPQEDPGFRQRFAIAAVSAATVNHPNVARVLGVSEADGELYIAMELVRGQNLAEMLAESQRFASDRALSIGIRVARALGAAHGAGVVHRDLKPGHVLIDESGQVKLVGFGLIKGYQRSEDGPLPGMTRSGAWIADPRYMAPEQIRGRGVDARTDFYAFGVMLFEMITGRPPFSSDAPNAVLGAHLREVAPLVSAIVPGTPRELDAIVARCLAKTPEERFQNAAELEGVMTQLLTGAPAPRATPAPAAPVVDDLLDDLAIDIEEPSGSQPIGAIFDEPGQQPPLLIAAFDTAAADVFSPSGDLPVAPERRRAGKRAALITAVVLFLLAIGAGAIWFTNPGWIPDLHDTDPLGEQR